MDKQATTKTQRLLQKSDDELDDDDLIEKLEVQARADKEDQEVDLDKMTRR